MISRRARKGLFLHCTSNDESAEDVGLGAQTQVDIGADIGTQIDAGIDQDLGLDIDKQLDQGVEDVVGAGATALQERDSGILLGRGGKGLGGEGEQGKSQDSWDKGGETHVDVRGVKKGRWVLCGVVCRRCCRSEEGVALLLV